MNTFVNGKHQTQDNGDFPDGNSTEIYLEWNTQKTSTVCKVLISNLGSA